MDAGETTGDSELVRVPCYQVRGFPKLLPQGADRVEIISWMKFPCFRLWAGSLMGCGDGMLALAAAGAYWALCSHAVNSPGAKTGMLLADEGGGRVRPLVDAELVEIVGVAPCDWRRVQRLLMGGQVGLLHCVFVTVSACQLDGDWSRSVQRDTQLGLSFPRPAQG